MREEPKDQRKKQAQDQARDDRKIEGGVFYTADDVTGKPPEPQQGLSAEVEKAAQKDEESTKDQDDAAEFPKRVHGRILPQAASSQPAPLASM